jgi:hypothetical protein
MMTRATVLARSHDRLGELESPGPAGAPVPEGAPAAGLPVPKLQHILKLALEELPEEPEGGSPEERLARLKEAGILDAEGHLAERYREPPRRQEADADRSVG